MEKRLILNSKILKLSRICALFIALLAIPVVSFSQEKATSGDDKPYDPKPAIFEHIGDAHSWHVGLPFVQPFAIPLPVILYTDKGLKYFHLLIYTKTAFIRVKTIIILVKDKIKIADASGKLMPLKKYMISLSPVTLQVCGLG